MSVESQLRSIQTRVESPQACTFSVACDQRGIQKMKVGSQTKFSVRICGTFLTHKTRMSQAQGEYNQIILRHCEFNATNVTQ